MTAEALELAAPERRAEASLTSVLAALDQLLDAAVARRVQAEASDFCDPQAAARIGAGCRHLPRLARMAHWLGLNDLDLTLVLFALAPEIDLRYEALYATLQDDASRRRPTPDLAANLLCRDAEERAALFAHLAPQAPLLQSTVFRRDWHATPLLAVPLVLDEMWRNFLLGRDELDARLARCARLLTGSASLNAGHLQPQAADAAKEVAGAALGGKAGVRLVLIGPHGAGKAALAAALAHDLELRLLVVDVRDAGSAAELRDLLQRARIASALHAALLYIHGANALAQHDAQAGRSLAETLAGWNAWFILSLQTPLPQMHTPALRARQIALELPSTVARLRMWTAALAANRMDADAGELERIAGRFRLSAAQIDQAAATVALTPSAGARTVSGAQLSAAARALCGDELAQLAQRIQPQATFAQLIATPEAEAQLREICARMDVREAVRSGWTAGSVHARHAGVTALFAGPSGTGKTLAAEVIANQLGYDLFRIDLSAVVSKYIGETEKNLDRVFAAAENANAVLFFDEADALFGKRSEVKDAHDRYANVEIAYLLQKMEQFDGLAILATNLKQNLDEAFARRLTFCVNFAFPEAGERRRLWHALWPAHAPLEDDVDLDWFAQEYPLSGGNIRNIVLAAIHLAATDGARVSREHLLHATRREYQKLGKSIAHPRAGVQRVAW